MSSAVDQSLSNLAAFGRPICGRLIEAPRRALSTADRRVGSGTEGGWRKTPQNSSLPPSTPAIRHAKTGPAEVEVEPENAAVQPGNMPSMSGALISDGKDCDARRFRSSRPRVAVAARSWRGTIPNRGGIRCMNSPRSSRFVTEYQRHRLSCPGCGRDDLRPTPDRRAERRLRPEN